MGTKTTCDGTGVDIPGDTPTTGMNGRQYCHEARKIAEDYLRDLDTTHTAMAMAFQKALTELRAKYREQLTQLPDDPT